MKPPVLQHRRLLKMTENQDEVIFGGESEKERRCKDEVSGVD